MWVQVCDCVYVFMLYMSVCEYMCMCDVKCEVYVCTHMIGLLL